MIALEVTINGKRVCLAGAEDLSVLSAHVTACGCLGKKTVPRRPDETRDFYYHVGGLTSRRDPEKDLHLAWKNIKPLKVGDVVQVRILEVPKADRALSRKKAKSRKS